MQSDVSLETYESSENVKLDEGSFIAYTSDTFTVADSTSFVSDGTFVQMVDTTDYATTTFASGVEYTEVLGKCTEPEVTPPTIPDQHYVINEILSHTLEVAYSAFTWTTYSDW